MSKSQNPKLLRDYLSLTKPLVTLGVTLTAFTGYVINAEEIFIPELISLVIGVMLMSGGAAAYNHIVERKTDSLMERTRHRPVASGRISSETARIFATLLTLLGFALLFLQTKPICALLGAINIAWYIWVYTPLKRKSVWAVFVGTITGVIPFFMGVFAATNHFINPLNLLVAAYLMMWQIPHFFLLAHRYGDEYHKAGIASIAKRINQGNIIKIYHLWVLACCLIAMLMPLLGLLTNFVSNWIVAATALSVIALTIFELLSKKRNIHFKLSFMATNLMQVVLMITLAVDNLI